MNMEYEIIREFVNVIFYLMCLYRMYEYNILLNF